MKVHMSIMEDGLIWSACSDLKNENDQDCQFAFVWELVTCKKCLKLKKVSK